MEKTKFVYIATNTLKTFIKIGFTARPLKRIYEIQNEARDRGLSPKDGIDIVRMALVVAGGRLMEKRMLVTFGRRLRLITGREFFAYNQPFMDAIGRRQNKPTDSRPGGLTADGLKQCVQGPEAWEVCRRKITESRQEARIARALKAVAAREAKRRAGSPS